MSDVAKVGTCGNCGAEVERDAITCVTCGALLSAYEAPDGAVSASMPVDVPSAFSIPAPPAPVPQSTTPTAAMKPTTESPITDALKGITADSGDGQDPLQPAPPSTLAQEIEAELADAKVTFDHGQATIVAAKDAATAEVAQAASAPTITRTDKPTATPTSTDKPVAKSLQGLGTQAPVSERRNAALPPLTLQQGLPSKTMPTDAQSVAKGKGSDTTARWIGVGTLFVLLLIISQANDGRFRSTIFLASALMIGWVLWRMAKSTSRRTTTMPWDKPAKKPRRRLP